MTKSTSATTMSPARASVPACAEKIFSAIVLPGMVISLQVQSLGERLRTAETER